MRKQYNIRLRESDRDEAKRIIKNYNAKIKRVLKKSPELEPYLPDQIKAKDFLLDVKTRNEFNRKLSSMQNFSSKRGSEKLVTSSRGAKAIQWEIDEFKNKQRIENIKRAHERKKIENTEVKTRGKKTGVKRAEMGGIKENALKPSRKKFDNVSQKEWDIAKKNIDSLLDNEKRVEKKEIMRANYIKGLIIEGFPESLIDLIKTVDIDVFVTTTQTDLEATFDFIYDPLEMQNKANTLMEVWKRAING